jgi:hypothetical protein
MVGSPTPNTTMIINYQILADAIEFYKINGFQEIPVPWIITEESINITKPIDKQSLPFLNKFLVGSAEQSFLEIRNTLKPGTYQATTPCFRDEIIDELHHNYFIKTELIETNPKNPKYSLEYILSTANKFFQQYQQTHITKTQEGYDININNIEVGSYGIRTYKDFTWVYGTGVALPRLQQTLNKTPKKSFTLCF